MREQLVSGDVAARWTPNPAPTNIEFSACPKHQHEITLAGQVIKRALCPSFKARVLRGLGGLWVVVVNDPNGICAQIP
jgi:hypothetical protein